MELFMQGLPPRCSDRQIKGFLKSPLQDIGILAFDVIIFRNGGRGTLRVPTIELGNALLARYGGQNGRRGHYGGGRPGLTMFGGTIRLSLSNRPPDRHAINALQEQQVRLAEELARPTRPRAEAPAVKKFNLGSMECGIWNVVENGDATFQSNYHSDRNGVLSFGRDGARIRLESSRQHSERAMIFIPYAEMVALTTSVYGRPHITFTCRYSPRFYKDSTPNVPQLGDEPDINGFFERLMQELRIDGANDEPSKVRASSLDIEHSLYSAFCFVYRFGLKSASDLRAIQRLAHHRGVPEIDAIHTQYRSTGEEFIRALEIVVTTSRSYDFPIAFQIARLVANGILPPQSILRLFGRISRLVFDHGSEVAANILMEFADKVNMPANPVERRGIFDEQTLVDTLGEITQNALRLRSQRDAIRSARENDGKLAAIHHAIITPAGCYFDGPKPETMNRVLRSYPDHHDYFLRVTFSEENGDSVVYERDVSHKFIYERFKNYMIRPSDGDGGKLAIGNREFTFLGFSGASLRSYTCWFMAPFVFGDEIVDAPALIANLGDFSHIRSPGKCAARIGQAFSNTFKSIHIPLHSERVIPDVERNNRCFSDGCGTISQEVVERIWMESPAMAQHRPTVFQIRFAGAKGVVSLDNRLQGEVLNLRPSMIKFTGSQARNIEICSSAQRPLPMFLNRPLIKILEDLGVQDEVFLTLQADEVRRLRDAAHTPTLAANFMQRRNIGIGQMKLPWLIKALQNLELSFKDDQFLGQAFELALIIALRDIKYRARIEIPKGFTVMGLMDETGFLQEGEVYCHVDNEGDEALLLGEIVITRAPAMHPGDVQICRAVSVPPGSPLEALRNCVVFSQHGNRDLPSMLSGGDLDGDLYNLIFDQRFRPQRISEGADYPRVPGTDLGRPIVTEDMVDFLIDFMQNDRLGLISIRHLIIADQNQEGVFHADCLKLAQMHSTAVDFPKTGIKVEISQLPKCSQSRPDFMAPGPHVLIEDSINYVPLQQPDEFEDDDEAENTPTRYYRSEKILGKLYRQINEERFVRQIQTEEDRTLNLIDDVWDYVMDFLQDEEYPLDVQWNSVESHLFARDLKMTYEASVRRMTRDYTLTPGAKPLREIEVFIGSIVGKGKQNKREKDNSTAMREDFERVLNHTIERIRGIYFEEEEAPRTGLEVLARSVACMSACSADTEEGRQLGEERLKSFAWVAASVTLQEIDKLQKRRRASQRRRARREQARLQEEEEEEEDEEEEGEEGWESYEEEEAADGVVLGEMSRQQPEVGRDGGDWHYVMSSDAATDGVPLGGRGW